MGEKWKTTRMPVAAPFVAAEKYDGSRRRPNLGVLPVSIEPAQLRPIAFRIFTKKHNLTLRSDALKVLTEHVGDRCGTDWRTTCEPILEEIAEAWKRFEEQTSLVSGDPLLGVLRTLDVPHSHRQESFLSTKSSATSEIENLTVPDAAVAPRVLEIDNYFSTIDAFQQPKYVYSSVRKMYELSESPAALFPPPEHLPNVFREHYHIIKQRLMRNELFQPPTFVGSATVTTSYHKITLIKNLLGRQGKDFLVFGMLTIAADEKIWLEDVDDRVQLDMTETSSAAGIFVPGCFVLAQGTYQHDGVFHVMTVGHPPSEKRAQSLRVFGHVDFLGSHEKGDMTATSTSAGGFDRYLTQAEAHQGRARVVIAADVFLDSQRSLDALRTMLETYESEVKPESPVLAIVLMGSYTSTRFQNNGMSSKYKGEHRQT